MGHTSSLPPKVKERSQINHFLSLAENGLYATDNVDKAVKESAKNYQGGSGYFRRCSHIVESVVSHFFKNAALHAVFVEPLPRVVEFKETRMRSVFGGFAPRKVRKSTEKNP